MCVSQGAQVWCVHANSRSMDSDMRPSPLEQDQFLSKMTALEKQDHTMEWNLYPLTRYQEKATQSSRVCLPGLLRRIEFLFRNALLV